MFVHDGFHFFHAIILCLSTENMYAINLWNILFIIIHVKCETVTMCSIFNSVQWLTAVTIYSVRYCFQFSTVQFSSVTWINKSFWIFQFQMIAVLLFCAKNFSELSRFSLKSTQFSSSQKFNGLIARNNRCLIMIDFIHVVNFDLNWETDNCVRAQWNIMFLIISQSTSTFIL